MGFFDFLVGSSTKQTNVEIIPDRIWMTTEAKLAGIAKELAESSTYGSVAILLVAHFPDLLARLEEIANEIQSNVPVQAVQAVLANRLNADLAATLNLDESAVIDIVVGERPPLTSMDDHLEQFADKLPCRCLLSHHVSLDDPVMQVFAGGWAKNALVKLGMSEEEPIESDMVSRRIRHAQQKIGKKTRQHDDAESAAEWFERNCPDWVKR